MLKTEEFFDKNRVKGFLDVLDTYNHMIYDYKFGYPTMSPEQFYNTRQMIKYRTAWPGYNTKVIKPKY